MNLKPSEIFSRFSQQGLITRHDGPDHAIGRFAPVEDCGPGDLVFVDNAKYLPLVREHQPSAVITSEAIANELTEGDDLAILVAANVRLATALVKQAYDDRDYRTDEWPRVHPSAVIHESVQVPTDAVIGPGVVIGANVSLGEGAVLLANVVVEHDARIGAQTVLHPGVVISYGCEVGAQAMLKAGCVIGSEGFGFAQDEKRHNYRIPHTGKVVIEDRVVIGANTTIDRGTYGATVIRAGTVIDALCHIGHNVEIDEDCILCAHTGISGSSRFGKRVIASGQTGVLDHVSVASDSVLLHRAGVNNSIKEPGMYAGGPVQPLQQYLKNMAVMPRLTEIWSRLKKLEKAVAGLAASAPAKD
ncbi:UDP-3-O-(3-hydroxymyristoyl)glucosamine N-acyltransferase [Methylococcus sp. EFPC2]|uniref:UDP-3-O-(3-hydroxymyristoyl)glucosamine N-acyltransferase n=1 Tax=Methylococcus sp. EFPC2 TaxID=2812648 RepID=UPI0019682700|nr:UDP-3-O-(3-hydroxymyristoyl)glucosamine N-acyltransferase [Methylococcus sp. EFPC2]QSA95891.1 UDP-3-O-(3-hydroxymyristoyl)glucosamine N-acyltransferase [Methylococcus sp. EFPC2]